ncbi:MULTISPECIES: hypothetical protein [unclassified Photorhabdus]|uniref:hypothetical protein n=1 Tax=unclassified Photorhabdus TaxID=2620880 RepID=UPI000DCEC301|nr:MULTISPECIES: hypothetical protein [unclassified Photorhabdus]RAX00273.1 hypothetical protein CKY03_07785 [Photorhabdus sp. S9-53]RAX00467.1 hypothetical protein CKY05_07640 [Photorhabdus sp. S10-54]RAX04775.1 hypothetical protein CKY04_07705 [Photorhabdus sp. S8-52]
MATYHIYRQEDFNNTRRYAKAGVPVNQVSILTADHTQTPASTDPSFKWVFNNTSVPVDGMITTISQLDTDLYWVRRDVFTAGGKSYTGIELESQSPTKSKLQVRLKKPSFGFGQGYDLYSLNNEYIIIVYDPIKERHRICLSADPDPLGYHKWYFNQVT